MSNWRPEDWDKNDPLLTEADWDDSADIGEKCYEAGADAMLEAISEEIEKGLLTDEELLEARGCDAWGLEVEALMEKVAQAQLQKILALLRSK